ncbi:hypothetical protein Tco_0823675 [Tanacetum coccineum]|uniref:Uncharacterized protein n=1 Tax=Tanacetum coccineum TaxID=301880 RepID=A0ABQ5AMM0_9ASTR
MLEGHMFDDKDVDRSHAPVMDSRCVVLLEIAKYSTSVTTHVKSNTNVLGGAFLKAMLKVENTGIHDAILRGGRNGSDVGSGTILPSSFVGDKFLGLKARDRPDAVAQFFEINVKEMVKFLKERKPLGDIVADGKDVNDEFDGVE